MVKMGQHGAITQKKKKIPAFSACDFALACVEIKGVNRSQRGPTTTQNDNVFTV